MNWRDIVSDGVYIVVIAGLVAGIMREERWSRRERMRREIQEEMRQVARDERGRFRRVK